MILETNQSWNCAQAPALSVVMIGHRSVPLLSRAIHSLVRHCRAGCWELVLVVNGDHAGVNDFVTALLGTETLPLALVKVAEQRPGAARNAGVRAARAPLLFFLDDDIECFQDILSAAVELFKVEAIDAAGGANLTPLWSPALARATGGVMASHLGAAGMRRRYRVSEGVADEHSLILCNLAVRKSLFESERGFARHLISNEENVLLQRLSSRGARLWSSPRLAVFHRRRECWAGLVSQAAKYGSGRAQNLLLIPESFRALYFLPALLLVYLALSPWLALSLGSAAFAPLVLYAGLSAAQALILAARERDPAQLLGALVLPAVHLSYGFGFLRAFFSWTHRREKLREHAV